MPIVVNARLPHEALQRLQQQETVVPFFAPTVPWTQLRGHADLFITHIPATTPQWVVAPNTPDECRKAFSRAGIDCHAGCTPAALDTASCGAYNVACSDQVAVGSRRQCDPTLLSLLQNHLFIDVRQGMARCSTLFVAGRAALTSDKGIHNALLRHGIDSLLVSQKEIRLPGYPYGCIGGCAGLWNDKVLWVGSLRHHPQGENIRTFLHRHNKESIELCDHPLTDIGSIFIIPQHIL